ncbi:MAG: adenosylmethionine decarboxylase [Colwellia sp.]|nr:adenosylmethionine decarboxylase [Colwellia sp.]
MTDIRKLQLYGFNNLTKNLSFSFYKLHYIHKPEHQAHYNDYINERYSSQRLSLLLTDICHAIGGNVLNVAQQNYQPQGASVTLMISEEAQAESLVAHLDKSHLCIHTYPEDNIQDGIAIFRADIELSTCGVISPLKVLNYLLEEFNADVIDIDYRIRGMTRGVSGQKNFNDQKLSNISDCLDQQSITKYHIKNNNLLSSKLFHTKLIKKEVITSDFLFKTSTDEISKDKQSQILNLVYEELQELFDSTEHT